MRGSGHDEEGSLRAVLALRRAECGIRWRRWRTSWPTRLSLKRMRTATRRTWSCGQRWVGRLGSGGRPWWSPPDYRPVHDDLREFDFGHSGMPDLDQAD